MIEKILRRPAVIEMTGLSTTEIYKRMNAGTFPRPVRLSKQAVGWRLSDVQAWIATLKTDVEAA